MIKYSLKLGIVPPYFSYKYNFIYIKTKKSLMLKIKYDKYSLKLGIVPSYFSYKYNYIYLDCVSSS